MTADYQLLDDIRVIEFTHAVMGPSAGLVLADMGAEVIRLEPAPDGDRTRRLEGFGAGFYPFFNRNKKSVAVDVKTAVGREIVYKLVGTADILIENFAPGTMKRLGLDYQALSSMNPRLIYGRLKGFLDGPFANRTALDEVVQMMSGLAYMTGPPGQPLRAGASIIDILSGTFGALALLAALRDRDRRGKGGLVETGLFETAAYLMGQHMAYSAVNEEPVPPMTTRVSPWSVYRLFSTKDNQLVFIGITSDKQWRAFCRAFERLDWLADPALETNNGRINAQESLMPALERFFAALPLADITIRCQEAGIPFAPVNRPEDLFDHPHLKPSGGLVETELADGRPASLPRLPLAYNQDRFDLRMSAPELGAHTRQILSQLGYTSDQIGQWQASKIIVARPAPADPAA